MAYGRRKGAKRPARKGGKGVSKLAKAKPTAITTLAKAVKSLQSRMTRQKVILNFGDKIDYALMSGNYNYWHLSNISQWNPIFGASSNDTEANSCIHKSMGLDMRFESNNETDAINFTVFIVSLKDDANGIFNNNTGGLSLTNDVDYHTVDALAMVNKKSFNIHYVKRFTLGNNGVGLGSSTAQTQFGTDRRFYTKVRVNKKIVNASRGDWKQLTCSPDPSDNYYLLVFNDNNILDATYPRIRVNIVHTVEQLA